MTNSIKTLAAAVATLGLFGAHDALAATWGDFGSYQQRYGRYYDRMPVAVATPAYTQAFVPASPRTNLCETDEGVLRTVWGPAGTRCRVVTPSGDLARGTRIPR